MKLHNLRDIPWDSRSSRSASGQAQEETTLLLSTELSSPTFLPLSPDPAHSTPSQKSPTSRGRHLETFYERTSRAYDLVCNYERDAMGGKRWLSEDIAHIRTLGKHLHHHMVSLRAWQRHAAVCDCDGGDMLRHMAYEELALRNLCQGILAAIDQCEQYPTHHAKQTRIDRYGHSIEDGLSIPSAVQPKPADKGEPEEACCKQTTRIG